MQCLYFHTKDYNIKRQVEDPHCITTSTHDLGLDVKVEIYNIAITLNRLPHCDNRWLVSMIYLGWELHVMHVIAIWVQAILSLFILLLCQSYDHQANNDLKCRKYIYMKTLYIASIYMHQFKVEKYASAI